MKQFQKYGVAAAVASLAAGALAQPAAEVSKNEAGDLAIIPYYTVEGGKNTGMHIINTTAKTQVVKVRLRRGADSKDALDFNLVMSPYDEWTANIGAGGDTGVQVTTNDSTCTVPEFPNGVAQMPDTYAEGATEGYVEIIGMAEPLFNATAKTTEAYYFTAAAKHQTATTGEPLNCDWVRDHFYRVDAADVGAAAVRGTHTSSLASWGFCSAGSGGATDSTLCSAAGAATNLVLFDDTQDNALKVSYFITDSDGGLEIGDNAVHIEGFADAPMMTNQQPLSFGTAGVLQYDPLNFELPNLAYGAWASSNDATSTAGAAGLDRQAAGAIATSTIGSGEMFDSLRNALQANALINDWASFETADGSSVETDWVVTLPGQYVMNNPICDLYDAYSLAADACVYTASAVANGSGVLPIPGYLDRDELPLVLASNATNNPISGNSNLSLFDREELALNPPNPVSDSDLGFSPGGSAGDPTQTAVLLREVNVISINDSNVLDSADLQDEDFGLRVVVDLPGDADRGWAELAIVRSNDGEVWTPNAAGLAVGDGGNVDPNQDNDGLGDGWGTFRDVTEADNTMAIGFAAWERSFADQAGNYGRLIEHTTTTSAGGSR